MMTYKKNITLFWIKSALISKKNLIVSQCIIPVFSKAKENLMAMELQIFMISKLQRWTLIMLV